MSLSDSSTWPQYAAIDREFEAALKLAPPLPSIGDMPSVAAARDMFSQAMVQFASLSAQPDYTGVKKSTIQIPVRDGTSIPAVLYQPETASNDGPLVVLYHGGGFCLGAPEMEEPIALECVRRYGAVALSVDYRMAPEHPFPVAIEDSFDALEWAAANASTLGANPKKGFLIGGTSAGGTICAAISHMARDEKLSPPLTGVWLSIPHTVGKTVIPEKYKREHTSFEQNRDAPILDVKAVDFFMRNYTPVDDDPKHSPLLWPGGHKNLPPHFIQCCGLDPLRDDALLYHRELLEQGVTSETIVYPGVPHGFDAAFAQIALGKKFAQDRSEGFASLLRR